MNDVTAGRAAVVVPGMGYGPQAPLLMYAGEAAEARGARVQYISWTPPADLPHLDPTARCQWVLEQVTPVVDQVAEGSRSGSLLIAKSLGTNSAALAADSGLPAIWLTPLLNSHCVVDALRRATAPFLLVGGTADKSWDGRLARDLSRHVLEIDEADHGLFVPGPLARSAAVLGQVVTAVEQFLDESVWT